VLRLAAKVRYVLDPTIDYPRHFSGHVKVCPRRRHDLGRKPAASARRFGRSASAGRNQG
jgi:hypothetical protein